METVARQFDEEGYALDERLKDYIKNNMFLNQQQIDYDDITHTFE